MGKGIVENYYKTLGTTAKIGNRRIKEKYIQAIKKHPPETDPEGFEKVRRAYETLRDPEKRKQYDLMRKYGSSVEDIMEKAYVAMEKMNFDKAEKLLEQASKIAPDNQSVIITRMMLAIMSDELDQSVVLFEQVLNMTTDPEEITAFYSLKARFLLENDYPAEALETLDQGRKSLPDKGSLFTVSTASIYMSMERYEEAWDVINSGIPTPEKEVFEDLYTFVTWTNIMVSTERWQDSSKVQSRFRKFLKKLTDEEEVEEAKELLTEEFEEPFEVGDFRTAEFYGELLKTIDKDFDKDMKERLNLAKQQGRIQKQLGRLEGDEVMFPLIFLHAFEWYHKDYLPADQLSMMLNSLPSELIEELKEEKEGYAAGIIRLQKKYPLLYKAYKEKWDGLFEELTEGFNREMRRELRRAK